MAYTAILIDDEAWTRAVLRKLGSWQELGIEIIAEASDGKYGLELINRLQPDIIVTDVKMPHVDGIQLLKAVRESGNLAKVIFISGYDDYEYVRSAIKLNASDYLLKPIKQSELNQQLARCVAELAMQKEKAPFQTIQLKGFIDASWEEEYQILRNKIFEALHSEDPEILEKHFTALDTLVQKEGENAPMSSGTIIGVYYELNSRLQRYIWESGYELDEVFTVSLPTFVFSNQVTFSDMLFHIKKLYLHTRQTVGDLEKLEKKIDTQKVEHYVQANFAKGITLESVADRFCISKEYLSKIFKKKTGVNFSVYITNLRMEKAKELLLVQKLPIKDIVFLTGYTDTAHFYKVFKKHFGETPGEMQKYVKNRQ